MNQPVIFNCSAGPIRALHGVNCAPYSRSSQNDQRLITRVFREGGIPYSRLRDCCGMLPSRRRRGSPCRPAAWIWHSITMRP